MAKHDRTDFDIARDELMSHIHRCGVLKASQEQQEEWLNDTMQYMAERFASLTDEQIGELQEIGRRFCQPVISHGRDHTALNDSTDTTDSEQEMAGAA